MPCLAGFLHRNAGISDTHSHIAQVSKQKKLKEFIYEIIARLRGKKGMKEGYYWIYTYIHYLDQII